MGGHYPVSVQSMTNLPIEDIEGNIRQIEALRKSGAAFVRLAVRNMESVVSFEKIAASVSVPLIADIHFNYRIAIEAMRSGAAKVRINPGNIGDERRVREVVKAARDHGVPIRIGVNAGSIDRKKYASPTPEALVDSAMAEVAILEDMGFQDIAVSIKSSDVFHTIEANRIFSELRDYPLHTGLTEAGYGLSCVVQSTLVIGHLLMLGLGDTIRVSMTGDPVEEVLVAKKILESTGDMRPPVRMIACPTCGRTDQSLNLLDLAERLEREITVRFSPELLRTGRTLTIAVMGCEVNGPGEAHDADFGVAGAGRGNMLLFSRGEKRGTVKSENALGAMVIEIEKFLAGR